MSFVSELGSIFSALRARLRGQNPDVLGVRKPERETLNGFADWYRQVVVNKVDGLSRDDATRVMTPTGLSPLGIVKHLAWAETGWFRDTFGGESARGDVPVDESFVVAPDDTVESVIASYRDACEHSRRVVRAAPLLDKLSARESSYRGRTSLRWILIHMIEETARHAGHLDIMREQIDGRTGD